MDAWVLWLLATVALAFGEIATTRLVLGSLAIGAIAGSLASLVGSGTTTTWIVFAVVSTVFLVATRPFARRHLREHARERLVTEGMVGRPARVVERVANFEGTGIVELSGEVWNARAFDADEVYEPGERVEVVEVRGATALVVAD